MPPRLTVETEIYAEYTQFYVGDPKAAPDADVWDGPGLERHLAVADGIIAVGTVGYTDVPVVLELWDEEPPLDADSWDHVVDASLDVRSGLLALADVSGEAREPLEVAPGVYRVRTAAAGLDGADEMDGGDRYRVQLWLAPAAEPEVRKWWPAWDPSGVRPRPTRPGGRVVIGAAAHEARVRMSWLASRGVAHLFKDADGVLWEHSSLQDSSGTPQLEELDEAEAERRYGPSDRWSTWSPATPSLGEMLRNIADTLRYQQGWRPEPDPKEAVLEDGRRVHLGNTAANRVATMTWVSAADGDNLHVDEDGSYWELRRRESRREKQRLVELTREEAEAKYGRLD